MHGVAMVGDSTVVRVAACTLLLGELTDGRQQCVHLGERVAEHAVEGNATQEGNG